MMCVNLTVSIMEAFLPSLWRHREQIMGTEVGAGSPLDPQPGVRSLQVRGWRPCSVPDPEAPGMLHWEL